MNSEPGATLRNLPGPVLITGHTGFKGVWLTLLLERLNIGVIGYSLSPEAGSLYSRLKREGRIREVYSNILDDSSLRKFISLHRPSVIFHLAAQPLVLRSYEIPVETFEVNVTGTANVLNAAFLSDSVVAIGAVTTDKVYRNLNTGRRFKESDPLEGKDPYSASKVGSEAVISAFQNLSEIKGGPKLIALRAGNVIGGGDSAQNRLIPDLIRAVERNCTMKIRNPDSTRPWQHVLDPLFGYLLAIESALQGNFHRAFNFGPIEESLPVSQVIEVFKESLGVGIEIISDVGTSNLESKLLGLSVELAMSELSWKPALTQLEAIEETFRWWKGVLDGTFTPMEAVSADIENYLTKLG
jgi:CDP-glucose 4,6-dehydratase